MHVRSRSVSDTREIAAVIADLARPGDVLVLTGDLGAGKTAFVQGLATALGIDERVTSPTFTLHQVYEGRLRLHHLDVYRLDNLGEVLDVDLPELLDDGGLVAIEWGEVVVPELPREFLQIRLMLGHPEDIADARVIEIEPVGTGWSARHRALTAGLEPWTDEAPGRTI